MRVEDEGIGIPADKLKHIFDPFIRVQTQETSRIEGTGLGLAIAKTFVEDHDSQIFVESTLGKGSTFWFSLPLLED